jgi:hypothetical protein
MKGIRTVLVPTLDFDYQSFTFEELGVTYSEWSKLSEDGKKYLVLDNRFFMENIRSFIDSIEEY